MSLLLLEVADALLRNPSLELIEIQGHTDSTGEESYNLTLGETLDFTYDEVGNRRARSSGTPADTYLYEKGSNRLQRVGSSFSPASPLA